MGALAAFDRDDVPHGLENPIHPCFERERWVVETDMPKHKGAIPILGGEDGFWMVSSLDLGHTNPHRELSNMV